MTDSELQNIIKKKLQDMPIDGRGNWEAMEALLDSDQTVNPVAWKKILSAGVVLILTSLSLYFIFSNSNSSKRDTLKDIITLNKNEVSPKVSEIKNDGLFSKETHDESLMENTPIKEDLAEEVEIEKSMLLRSSFDIFSAKRKVSDTDLSQSSLPTLTVPLQKEVELIISIENQPDSSRQYISRIFNRNRNKWKNSVAVVDWTSSIYPFAGDIIKWLEQHKNQKKIQDFVFFTDCDRFGNPTSESGLEGAMFTSSSSQSSNVKSVMLDALRNGLKNTDWKENDMEALLFAQENFPESKELILIADNSNSVKNYKELVHYIKKPVRIILCGNTEVAEKAIQQEYWKLAKITGGSIHLIDQDFYNVGGLRNGTIIRVGKYLYSYYYSNKFSLITSKKEYLDRGMIFPL